MVSVRPTGSEVPRAAARLARQVELGLADRDLSLPQYRVLVFLSEMGSSAARALADRMGVTPPSVTAMVDGLSARGLVERRPSATDRRRVDVVLTASGEEELVAADRAVDARLAAVATHLDAVEAALACGGLETWCVALDRARDELLGSA